MKKCVITGFVCSVVSVMLMCGILALAEYEDEKYSVNYLEEFYGGEVYAEIDIPCAADDLKEVLPVLEFADEAFSYIGTDEEAERKFGRLGRYSAREGAVSEEHTLSFITASLEGDSGYMWIMYSQSCFDGNGGTPSGSYGVTSRWTLTKTDGSWTVTDIWEHP